MPRKINTNHAQILIFPSVEREWSEWLFLFCLRGRGMPLFLQYYYANLTSFNILDPPLLYIRAWELRIQNKHVAVWFYMLGTLWHIINKFNFTVRNRTHNVPIWMFMIIRQLKSNNFDVGLYLLCDNCCISGYFRNYQIFAFLQSLFHHNIFNTQKLYPVLFGIRKFSKKK